MNAGRSLLLVIAVFAGPSASMGYPDDAERARQALVAAWKQRSQAVQSVRIRWTQLVYQDASAAYGVARQHARQLRMIDPDAVVPAEDPIIQKEGKTHEEKIVVTIGGDRMRYEADFVRWSTTLNRFVDRHFISAWNGEKSKTLWGKDEGESRADGYLMTRQGNYNAIMAEVQPMMWWCRPFDPLLGRLDADHFEPSGPIVGARTESFTFRHAEPGGGHCEMTTDPKRSFAVTRYAKYDAYGVLNIQGTLVYAPDDTAGVVPTSCEVTALGADGNVHISYKIRVDELALNVSPAPEEFELEFAPGTWVNESKRSYIVRKSGGEREVLRSELIGGATYADLASTEPGEAPNRRRTDWGSIAIGGCVVLAALFAVLHLRARKRAAR